MADSDVLGRVPQAYSVCFSTLQLQSIVLGREVYCVSTIQRRNAGQASLQLSILLLRGPNIRRWRTLNLVETKATSTYWAGELAAGVLLTQNHLFSSISLHRVTDFDNHLLAQHQIAGGVAFYKTQRNATGPSKQTGRW